MLPVCYRSRDLEHMLVIFTAALWATVITSHTPCILLLQGAKNLLNHKQGDLVPELCNSKAQCWALSHIQNKHDHQRLNTSDRLEASSLGDTSMNSNGANQFTVSCKCMSELDLRECGHLSKYKKSTKGSVHKKCTERAKYGCLCHGRPSPASFYDVLDLHRHPPAALNVDRPVNRMIIQTLPHAGTGCAYTLTVLTSLLSG